MVGQVLGGAVLAVTLTCLARLVLHWQGGTERSLDFTHAFMGVGMIMMFLPPVVPAVILAALFLAHAAWLGSLALRRRPARIYLHHLVGALAMAYMFAAARPHDPAAPPFSVSSAHSGAHGHGDAVTVLGAQPSGFAFPLVAWGLLIYCALSAGFAGTDLFRPSPACHDRSSPRLTSAIELVLALSMGYMFLTTL